MNCRTARKLVQARHDGGLPAARDSVLQQHLVACAACSRLASRIELAQRWLRDLPPAQPSDNFDWRLKLRLSQAERERPAALPAALPPSRRVWTLQFVVSTAAAALLVLATGIVFTLRQDGAPGPAGETVVSVPPAGTWGPSPGSRARPGWPRLVPVRAGAPLGPERHAIASPSILGEAQADTTFLEDSRRGEPVRVHPVGY